jgi:uncharacterized protein YdiU (UPF0061 family)
MYLDDSGRYAYKEQPSICKWNCGKLAEAIAPFLPIAKSKLILNKFDEEYDRVYMNKMRQKVEFVLSFTEKKLFLFSFSLVLSKNNWKRISRFFMGELICLFSFD